LPSLETDERKTLMSGIGSQSCKIILLMCYTTLLFSSIISSVILFFSCAICLALVLVSLVAFVDVFMIGNATHTCFAIRQKVHWLITQTAYFPAWIPTYLTYFLRVYHFKHEARCFERLLRSLLQSLLTHLFSLGVSWHQDIDDRRHLQNPLYRSHHYHCHGSFSTPFSSSSAMFP
jgi:hypothetical protein